MDCSEKISFCDSNLPIASFSVLEDMRRKEELCDIVIKMGNSQLAAHRVVLAAVFPYFREVFSSSTSTSEGITIESVDPTVLESLIHFAYTSRIDITAENAQSLLVVSKLFQLGQVEDMCIKYLSERLAISNVAQVHTFALNCNSTTLIENSGNYIKQNFEIFCQTDGFLQLSHSCVKEIISQNDLRISREEIVFEAVMKWTKFSPQERQEFLPELLSEVRMVHIPLCYLISQVASEDLIKLSMPCRDLIQNAQSYHVLSKQESSFPSLRTQPRTCGYTMNGIYAVCNPKSLGYCVYRCDLIRCTWNLMTFDKLQLQDYLCGVVAVNESIFLVFENAIAIFHPKTLEWEILKTTHKGLAGAVLTSHKNFICCFGSYRPSLQKKVRCFDTQMNQCLREDKWDTFRYNCAVASLHESVYVTGGGFKSQNEPVNFVEEYNPVTGFCSVITPMLHVRRSHGCSSLNGKVYVCGGYNGYKELKTSEMFDPLINKWTSIMSNISARSTCTLIPQNDKLFAIQNSKNGCDDIETYDEKSGEWIKCSFSVPRGFINAAAISISK